MADLQVKGGRVVYIDENGNDAYALPTRGGIPGQSVIYDEDGNLTSGIGVSTLGSLSNVDSTSDSAAVGQVLSFNGVYWEATDLSIGGVVFDSAYVQARQDFSYTSLINTPNILDSTNVEAIIDADYVNSLGVVGTDSNAVADIIAQVVNNLYVRNRQDYAYSSLTGAPTAVSAFSNDAGYLTSATVTGVIDQSYVTGLIDATYLDEDEVVALVDSDYVQSRQDYSYGSLIDLPDFFDSNDAIILIDSDYVQARQQNFDFLDSAEAINLIDSDYVQARQDYSYGSLIDLPDLFDSNDATVLIDADYVQARQDYSYGSLIDLPDLFDSTDATILVDSDYVQARQDYSYESLINLPDFFDSTDATILVDSDYVQTRQDNHNLSSDINNTTVAANFIPDADATRTLGSSSNRFSTIFGALPVYDSIGALPDPDLPGEMGFVPSLQKIYISSGAGWFKLSIDNKNPVLLSVTDSAGNTGPYELSINEEPTTITIEAVDSDGDPLTYTYEASSSFSDFASISQNNNVFTITPFGPDIAPVVNSGSITFTISDGLANVNSEQTFTLDFRADWANIALEELLLGGGEGDNVGSSVSIEVDNMVTGLPGDGHSGFNGAGSVRVYTRSDSTWTALQTLKASDPSEDAEFGDAVALNGDTIIIGAPKDDGAFSNGGTAYVFTRDSANGSFTEQQKLYSSSGFINRQFGHSAAILRNTVIVGEPFSPTGNAYVFIRDSANGSFDDFQKLAASNLVNGDLFGWSLDLDSNTAVIGAYGDGSGGSSAGAAYVFMRDSENGYWTEQQKIMASNPSPSDYFGFSVGVDGDTIVVGAYFEDTEASNAGAAYIFTRDSARGFFEEEVKLTADDASSGDEFGRAVAIRNDIVVVGAPDEDSISSDAGAAYIFGLDSTGQNWEQIVKLGPTGTNDDGLFGIAVDVTLNTVTIGAKNSYGTRGSVSVFKA